MTPIFTPLHHDLTFLTPLSEDRAAKLCNFIATRVHGTVVDVGCGWAELLIRVVESGPQIHGVGIDIDAKAIAHGQQIVQDRAVANRVTLIAGDVREHLPQEADGLLCIGASQVWSSPGQADTPLDYRGALCALRKLLKPGSPAVYGESIWTAEPTSEAIEPLGGRLDEFVFLPDLLDIARDCGFVVMGAHQATLDEWDQFESGFTAGYAHWLAQHLPEHVDAPDVRTRLLAQSNAYYKGYRGILGMAYLELLAV